MIDHVTTATDTKTPAPVQQDVICKKESSLTTTNFEGMLCYFYLKKCSSNFEDRGSMAAPYHDLLLASNPPE